jgi:predicted acyltransferase
MSRRGPNGAAAAAAARRLRFLDVARALAVLAMLLANLVNVLLTERPRWLGHNLGDELLPLDLPAPIFQFLIGISLALFLARRRGAQSVHGARALAARRFALLIVLGAILDGLAAGRLEFRWGVLQTLGAGGLLAVAVAGVPDALILTVAALITAVHYGPGNNEVHRSLLDCLPFLPITLVGYVIGRPLAHGDVAAFDRRSLAAAYGCMALAIVLRAAGIPFNKVTGSSSFVAVALSASATLVAALHRLEARGWRFSHVLTGLGANALTAWVLQYLLIYYPVELVIGGPVALSEVSGLIAVAAGIAALTAATLALARAGIRVPL